MIFLFLLLGIIAFSLYIFAWGNCGDLSLGTWDDWSQCVGVVSICAVLFVLVQLLKYFGG